MEQIRFDDIEKLKTKVSDSFGPFGAEVQITQDMINKFADLTGDHQWIHVDVERCKRESPFKQPIAHGFLTLSLLPVLRAGSDYQIVGYGNATNYGADKLRFVSPVPAGSKVQARSRLVAVEAKPKGTQVTQDMINRFAELTGDHQWIHVDVERCKKESPFGGPIAHGFLTLSLLPRLRSRTDFAIVGHGNAVNYGANKLRFLAPVPAGSKVRARSRLINVEAKPKGTMVTQEITVGIVGQETPALLYEMIVLYNPPRR